MTRDSSDNSQSSSSSDAGPGIDIALCKRDLKDWQIGRKLGEGGYGLIVQAIKKNDPDARRMAVKAIPLSALKKLGISLKVFLERLDKIEQLKHRNIASVSFHLKTKHAVYMFMDEISPRTLFDRLAELPGERASEEDSRALARSLCQVISYCHKQLVMHRDVKPDNVFFRDDDSPFGDALLGDWDTVTIGKKPDQKFRSEGIGTPGFMPPEVVDMKHFGQRVDEFCLGASLHEVLTGQPLLLGDTTEDLKAELLEQDIEFDANAWKDVSRDARDFVWQLLQKNPDKRMTADDALQHRWLTGKRKGDETEDGRRKSRRIAQSYAQRA